MKKIKALSSELLALKSVEWEDGRKETIRRVGKELLKMASKREKAQKRAKI